MHVEQDMPLGRIGMTASDQAFDHRDHLGDEIGRARLLELRIVAVIDAEGGHVVVEPLGGGAGELVNLDPLLGRAVDDLVLHIGDVAHIGDVLGPVDVAQQPIEHVEHHHGPGIAQMRAVIDGGSTDIHAHVFGVDRLQPFHSPRHGVAQSDLDHLFGLLPVADAPARLRGGPSRFGGRMEPRAGVSGRVATRLRMVCILLHTKRSRTTDIMHEAFADRICSGMDRAVREQPFGPGMVVWTIDGYMFAAYTEAGGGLSVRVPKAEAQRMAANGDAASHETPMSGAGWVLIPWATPPEDLRRRIAASYDMVRTDRNGVLPEA
jgi:hypothetical protein